MDSPSEATNTGYADVLLTVVVVCLNDAHRLGVALASIAEQTTLSDVEVLVIDGGSTDSTPELLAEFLPKLPLRTLVGPDRGIYDAMNKGAAAARGEYLYFLNCGDAFCTNDTLEQLLTGIRTAAASGPALWMIGNVLHLRGGAAAPIITRTRPFSVSRLLLTRQDYNHQACIFARQAFVLIGGFDLSFDIVADYDLILRLGVLREPRYLDLVIAQYEGGGLSALRRAELPLLQHEVRASRLGITGFARWLSRAYGVLQTTRRFGVLVGWRAMRRREGWSP